MKKIVLLACVILLPLAALAQQNHFRTQAGPNGPQDPVRMVAEYLELTR